jgi:ATP-dependent Clp protease adapter protein ClpS
MAIPQTDRTVRRDAQVKNQARDAPRYRVMLHHDGLHAARYVVQVLQEVFHFSQDGAEEITLEALYNGAALCAIEALERAKVHAARLISANLMATIEPES